MSRARLPDEGRNELRQRLDEIGGRLPKDAALHRDRVEALRATCRHRIMYIEEGTGDRSDCMVYALEIPIELVVITATLEVFSTNFSRWCFPDF